MAFYEFLHIKFLNNTYLIALSLSLIGYLFIRRNCMADVCRHGLKKLRLLQTTGQYFRKALCISFYLIFVSFEIIRYQVPTYYQVVLTFFYFISKIRV